MNWDVMYLIQMAKLGRRALIVTGVTLGVLAIEEISFGFLRRLFSNTHKQREKTTILDIERVVSRTDYDILKRGGDSNAPDLVIIAETHTPGVFNKDNQDVLNGLMTSGDRLLLEGYFTSSSDRRGLVHSIDDYLGERLSDYVLFDVHQSSLDQQNSGRKREFPTLFRKYDKMILPFDLLFVSVAIDAIGRTGNRMYHAGEKEMAQKYFQLYKRLQEFKEKKIWLPRIQRELETKEQFTTCYVLCGRQHLIDVNSGVDWKKIMRENIELAGTSYAIIGKR